MEKQNEKVKEWSGRNTVIMKPAGKEGIDYVAARGPCQRAVQGEEPELVTALSWGLCVRKVLYAWGVSFSCCASPALQLTLWFCHGPGSLSQLPPTGWDTNSSSVFWLQQSKPGLHLPYISFFRFCQLSWTFLTHGVQDLKENLTFQF